MYPQRPVGGGPLFLMLMGLGVAGAWMWVCHPATAQNVVAQQTDRRDAITLMVMVLGALVVLTASAGAWISIMNMLSKLAGLAFIVIFGFACYLAYQNYQDKHAGALAGGVEMPEPFQAAPEELTTRDANASNSSGAWWETPAAPEQEE